MAEPKRKMPKAAIRGIILLIVLGAIAFFSWRYAHRTEGYTGGDVTATGTVEAVHLQLAFKVPGQIADMPVNEGDYVRAGQLVAGLEPRDFDVQVNSARAALETARASIGQATATREKNARDLERQQLLTSRGYGTPQQLDAARADARVSSAQVRANTASAKQAETALAAAELQRSYAELRAPSPGVIIEKIHRPGEMVVVGTPVVTLSALDTVKVHAAVDETRVGAVRIGDKVVLRVYTFDRKQFVGEVSQIEAEGDFATRKDWGARRRDIRTFDVVALVPNPEHLLKDGMTADVTIAVSAPGRPLAVRP